MTPREPDRFEAKARELCASHVTYKEIAAALRAAESSALERAAQIADWHESRLIANSIRALIPPAAADAAEGELRRTVHGEEDAVPGEREEDAAGLVTCSTDTDEHHGAHRLRKPTRTEKSWCLEPVPVRAPAAETGMAQGAEARIAELRDRFRSNAKAADVAVSKGYIPSASEAWRVAAECMDELLVDARAAPPEREGK